MSKQNRRPESFNPVTGQFEYTPEQHRAMQEAGKRHIDAIRARNGERDPFADFE